MGKGGRPRKNKVDYFQHDCTHGRTIEILEQRFGNDGYAFWFKMLEVLGDSEGHFYDFSTDENSLYLSSKMNMPEEKCEEILDLLARLEAIDQDLWDDQKIIWSDNFVTRLSHVYAKRKTETPSKPCSRDEKEVSDTKTPHSIEEDSIEEFASSSEEGASPPENQESDSWKGRAMGWIRNHKQIDDDPRLNGKKKPVINWFGKLIHGPLGRGEHGRDRTKWFIENCLDRVLTEARQAENKNEVYAHLYQLWNQQLQSELLEARVFQENEDSPESKVNEIDEMLESAFS